MALTYNKATRDLSIKGTITLNNGTQIHIADSDILRYSFDPQIGSEGIPLGAAEATAYSLEISKANKAYSPEMFDNAEVHMFIGIKTNGQYVYSDFGVWYVDDCSAPEQSVTMTLTGYDALATRFSATFTDDKAVYPTTIGSIANAVCTAAGIPLKSVSFPNAATTISKMPEWGDDTTLRDILSYCAICAAGFVRIARNGQLEIVSFADGQTYRINPGLYQTFTPDGGADFKFNCIEAMLEEDAEDYERFAVDGNISSDATNTIQIEYNPLLTNAIVQSIVTELTGISMSAGELAWGGDPAVVCGDYYEISNLKGSTVKIMVTAQRFSFDGGLSVAESCILPTKNTQSSAAYSTSTNMYDSKGNIKASRVSGLDRSVVSATVGHFEQLTSETIEADELTTALLNAIDIKAKNIETDSVTTDVLTSTIASILEATIKKIEAGTIKTNELLAATATMFALKATQITASDIATDQFAAAFAKISVLTAGTANFDRATVAHLVAQAMNLEFGVGDNVFIKNLAVEYAQMVGAAIGNLCIKASDGNYYAIDVNENGTVTASRTTVSEGEIQAGQTNAGRVILETSITAQQLNTGNLLATYALVNRIDAARIDVDQLFAREAFIDLLRTSKIVGDKSIMMMVEEQNTASRTFRQETFPDGDDLVRPNDLLIIPSNGQTYQAVDLSDLNLQFYVDEDGGLHYSLNGSENVYGFEFLNHELYAEGLAFTLNEDGTWEKPYAWVRVQDKEILNSINALVDNVDGKTTTYVQDTTPVNASENDIWYNTTTGRILRYSGNTWADITTIALKAALDAAGDAQATADGKIITFAQTTAPAATSVGDLWINTANDNMIYRWNGSGWMPFRDQLILSVQNKAEFATVYDSETPPATAPETGKLWMDRSLTPPLLRRWKGTGTDTADLANWETVNDTATIETAQAEIAARQAALEAAQNSVATYLRLSHDTVHIGKGGVTSEAQIDPWGMGVAVKGKVFSRFEADRVRFGNMEMRRPAAGGLMLDAIDEAIATGVNM